MLVSTPQELSGLVVRKAAHLMNRLDVPILGIVENMSFYRCPKCGEEHAIFGASHSAQLAADLHTVLITRLPLDPTIAEQCDQGHVEAVVLPEMAALAKLIT
jgi:Mrp family chromosome partitioning ATPase